MLTSAPTPAHPFIRAQALNCSCFIPVWSGNHVSTYKGVKHIDGGFTNNLPVFDEHTIRICCFSGASDISPCDGARMEMLSGSFQGMPFDISWKNTRRMKRALFPPPASVIVGLLEQGFHDTKDFILTNDLIQCAKCYSGGLLGGDKIYAKVTPTISPAASPALSRSSSLLDFGDLQRASSFRRHLSASHEGRGAGAKPVTGFAAALRNKLQRVAAPGPARPADANNNSRPAPPTIVVDQAPELEPRPRAGKRIVSIIDIMNNGEPSEGVPGGRSGAAEPVADKFLAGRRATQARLDAGAALLPDRFSASPEPLPSCPPSPNLNRHCAECIRMRQEARLDLLDEHIRRAAERYRHVGEPGREWAGLVGRLAGPLRWFRQQMGAKSSYSFGGASQAALETLAT